MRRRRWLGLLALVVLTGVGVPAEAIDCIAHKFVSGKPDGADASLIRPSNWNACLTVSGGTDNQLLKRDSGAADGWSWVTAPDVYGPSYLILTNKTGVNLAVNDVVTLDTTNDSAVTLGDTSISVQAFVVAAESVANNVAGKFYRQGLVTLKVQGNVTRGRYLVKSVTTLAAQDSGITMTSTAFRPTGSFAIATTAYGGGGAGTVTAYLFGATAATAATLPAGGGSGTLSLGGILTSSLAIVGNDANTAEKVLHSRVIPGSTLTGTTRFRYHAFGDVAATANNKVIRLKWTSSAISPTTVVDSGTITTNLAGWEIRADGYYDGVSLVYLVGNLTVNTAGSTGPGAVTVHRVGVSTTLAFDPSQPTTLDLTGQSPTTGAANDVRIIASRLELWANAN